MVSIKNVTLGRYDLGSVEMDSVQLLCCTSNKELSLKMLKWRITKKKPLFSNHENKKKNITF